MNMAVFFQKYSYKKPVALFKRIYFKMMCRTNAQRVKYLRDAGAKIGNNCNIGSVSIFGTEPYLVEVGNNVYFSATPNLFTHDGGTMQLCYMGLTDKKYDNFGKIKIGDNCFIGAGSIILKNVTIGDNCIIGAGAVVSRSIPAGHVAAGVPAKVICTVEEYYEKNKETYSDTLGWNAYKKRQYIESHLDFYEKVRNARKGK